MKMKSKAKSTSGFVLVLDWGVGDFRYLYSFI